jgi:bacterioferritin
MKANPEILTTLNDLLAEELTAISQYTVHAEMCDQWGYESLHSAIEKQARDEMRHAELIIQRILFLEGMPTMSKLNPMQIGRAVDQIVANDEGAEQEAVNHYNAAIRKAIDLQDHGTREMLDRILKDEEGHLDWNEQQRDLIAQMGLQNYLTTKA